MGGEYLKFRLLRANEIDCRVATCSAKGVSLLLYKDARVDQNILDETVGPMGWQRSHSRDNANCTVSLWDSEKAQWISKEDTGTESNTEAAKGLASDSFKRACFNWGIGRELYTAPFVWIPARSCELYETGRTDRSGAPVMGCKTKFIVSAIDYTENREIKDLVICDQKTGAVVYEYHDNKPQRTEQKSAGQQKFDYASGDFEPLCECCGASVSERVHDYSVSKFGKVLCVACQKKQ